MTMGLASGDPAKNRPLPINTTKVPTLLWSVSDVGCGLPSTGATWEKETECVWSGSKSPDHHHVSVPEYRSVSSVSF